ncbi:MAG: efflux RND transporter permease subunit [Cyanobacteriota bacterium]
MSQVHWVKSLAKSFVDSKLTPVLIVVSLLLGVMAILILPREEEPQIVVPMADVLVEMPGASPAEVNERVIRHMEKLIQEVPGVEYIYSTAMPGKALMVVRFYVGDNLEDSLVKLYNKLYSNFDKIPPGVSKPLIKPRSIDDVPILTLTLWSDEYDGYTLRQIAAQLTESIRQTPDVSETEIIGGYKKYMRVDLLPAALSSYKVDPDIVLAAIKDSNNSAYLGNTATANKEILLKVNGFLSTKQQVEDVVVTVRDSKPVFLKDLANIELGPEEVNDYVLYKQKSGTQTSAVTITIAKRKGTNATNVADNVIEKVKEIRQEFVPDKVHIQITRNYGETAAERSNELLIHMFIAIFSVTALIWFVLGKKESLVVAIAIPTTLALTLATFVLYGFTLNRVTFFALIFSIGILVDDAIVVVENIVRHLRMPENKGRSPISIAIEATDEVGNPTILATIAVIAAILPMAFVGGLMGPYMRPIPIGSSSAMFFSMLVSFTIIPWAAVRIIGKSYKGNHSESEKPEEDFYTSSYRKNMNKLIFNKNSRWKFLLVIFIALLVSLSLVLFKLVKIKMLPFDNKSEFQVIIDTQEGTTLETTLKVAQEVADTLITEKDVDNYQIYAGVAAPFNFNGLVRRYYLRNGPNVADIQVNLIPKVNILNPVDWVDGFTGSKRFAQSHDIAKRIRPKVDKIVNKYYKEGASVKIAEVPPGPPVLQTLVAEVYGPNYEKQIKVAEEIKKVFKKNKNIVDVDWYMEDPYTELSMVIDHEKAKRMQVASEKVVNSLQIAFDGLNAGLLHDKNAKEDIPIWLQLPERLRGGVANIFALRLINDFGEPVPLDNIVKLAEVKGPKSIYNKNLLPVVYVTADVSGDLESPVYAIMQLYDEINNLKLPEGYKLKQYFTKQPFLNNKYSMKWDGEWHITYEVFRDLGLAFIVAIILIYALLVGWFGSYKTPLIIMSAIPFSLVGILPAHMIMGLLFGAFFTATSMIGFMAGAGIVVRNSIILVDFIELRMSQGMTLSDAVIDAGAIRFKPMMLTAAAVVVGSFVIIFDPIFQGLAISLMFGEVASLFLSRTAVPVFYYMFNKDTYLNSSLITVNIVDAQTIIDNSIPVTGDNL